MTKQELDNYLESIGGLVNGYYTNREPIKSSDFFEINSGWNQLVKDLIETLIQNGWNKQICQVKEKFGGLRFYINEANDKCYELITEAEIKSRITCEKCGKLTGKSWLITLCKNCQNS